MAFQRIEFGGELYEFPEEMKDTEIIGILNGLFDTSTTQNLASHETAKASQAGFELAIATVLKHEGGYVNDPDDPGGETNFGISKRSYPNVDIKRLKEEDAVEIYRADFWNKNKYGQMPMSVGGKMLDMAVNMGSAQANKLLQRVLGVEDDGIVGPITLGALENMDEEKVVRKLVESQKKFYEKITKKNPKLSKFMRGWTRRAESLPVEIGTEYQPVAEEEETVEPEQLAAAGPTPLSDEEIQRELDFLEVLEEEERLTRQEELRRRLGIGEFATNVTGNMKKVEGGLFEDPDGNLVVVDDRGNMTELNCG